VAAWERCRDRIEALEGRLRAWAWLAPLAGERRSGGAAAAAVAAGMCTASVDTQTADDVLRPAAYNAVVGFKPTFG
jgi:hypothetical protein